MQIGKYDFIQGTDVKKKGKSAQAAAQAKVKTPGPSGAGAPVASFAQSLSAAAEKKVGVTGSIVQPEKVQPQMKPPVLTTMSQVPAQAGQGLAEASGKAAQLDGLKQNMGIAAKSKDDAKLRKAAQEFEAIFLGMMFKNMKSTVGDGGLVEKSYAREMFEDMYMDEVGKDIAKNRGTGLGDMIYKQLKRNEENTKG